MRARLTAGALVVAAAITPASSTITAAAACEPPTSTSTVSDGFPNRLSSLYGTDIRTGRHECFERVVVEFGGTGELPGYQVAYEADPILDDPSGEPVDIAGEATLVIWFGAWMPTMEGDGYSGPREIAPGNVTSILELEQISNFEGMSAWAVGLDQQRAFTVFTLSDPVRIVVDIAVDTSTTPTTPATTVPAGSELPPTR